MTDLTQRSLFNEREELIADLRGLIDLHTWAHVVVSRAVSMLEADAQKEGSAFQREADYEAGYHFGFDRGLAQTVNRIPMTEAQIERLREKTFSTSNPYCPVDRKSMLKAVRATEAHYNIK